MKQLRAITATGLDLAQTRNAIRTRFPPSGRRPWLVRVEQHSSDVTGKCDSR